MPLQLITAPALEPLTPDDVRAWSRIDSSDDDQMLVALIKAARVFAENRTRRSLITQTWRMTLDAFPGSLLAGGSLCGPYSLPEHAIILEHPPVRSIVSIEYDAMDGTTQTMAPTDYVDLTSGGARRVDDPLRITPVFGAVWPISLPQMGSVRVQYVTGYGDDGASVPADILTWMKLRIAMLYENREEMLVGSGIGVQPLPYVDAMLDPYVVEFF